MSEKEMNFRKQLKSSHENHVSAANSNSTSNSANNEWIEIIEPKSKVQMFANLITGECRWDEPKNVHISRASNPLLTQWWELWDTNSQRFYYYCAKDSKTVWKRPNNSNSIVVPLAKLQILKQNTTQSSSPSQSFNPLTTQPLKCDATTQTTATLTTCSRATQTTHTKHFSPNNSILLLKNENSFRNPSLKHYLLSEARFAKTTMRENNNNANNNYDSNDDDFDDDNDDNELDDSDDFADDEFEDFNSFSDLSEDEDDDSEDDVAYHERDGCDAKLTANELMRISLRERQPITTTTQSFIPTKSHSLTQISNNNNLNKRQTTTATTTTTQTLTLRPQTPPSFQTTHLSLLPTQSLSSTTKTSKTTTISDKKKEEKQKSVTTTTTSSATTTTPTSSMLSIEMFAKENAIERHRKRGLVSALVSRKQSLKAMLEWTQTSIRRPMISSISDQKLIKESKLMFKYVMKFMKDLKEGVGGAGGVSGGGVTEGGGVGATSGGRSRIPETEDEIAFHLLSICVKQSLLRDELLVQISRQTNQNPSKESELKGLQLMCCCFWYFPPSTKLAPHLLAFLSNHSNAFARAVVKRKFEQQLRRSQQSHVVYVRKPFDVEEVSRVLRCVQSGFCGVFGEQLSDALVLGQFKRQIPWPIVCLTEALLKHNSNNTFDGSQDGNGSEREGVFRCVGDLDEVSRLKLKIDTCIVDNCHAHDLHSLEELFAREDIHVIASALKLYFRELKEPLIPYELYNDALEAAHNPFRASALINERMAAINRLSLSYLIRFLQVFSAPEHVRDTKMDDANLSMVWAPNILRSRPAAGVGGNGNGGGGNAINNSTIFEQTRSEMSFVRTLIQNFDTSFMSGIQ